MYIGSLGKRGRDDESRVVVQSLPRQDEPNWAWQMHPEVLEALKKLNMD